MHRAAATYAFQVRIIFYLHALFYLTPHTVRKQATLWVSCRVACTKKIAAPAL